MKAWKNGVLLEEAEDVLPEIAPTEPTAEDRISALEDLMNTLLGGDDT